MRNASFYYTQQQVRDGTKDVTRRLRWAWVTPGTQIMACVKCQGLGKGGKIEKIRPIEVVSVRREPLNAITQEECVREGFPNMTPAQFVEMFCGHMGCEPDAVVTRIEFKYL